jgi:hypothetical protein
VVFVAGVGDGFEELLVAVGSADVFWWSGSLTGQAAGVVGGGLDGHDVLDFDPVGPVVAEVVDVLEPAAHGRHLREPGLTLVARWVAPAFAVVNAVADTANRELVQVAVHPAERLLDRSVQVSQAGPAGNQEPAPHRRADRSEPP